MAATMQNKVRLIDLLIAFQAAARAALRSIVHCRSTTIANNAGGPWFAIRLVVRSGSRYKPNSNLRFSSESVRLAHRDAQADFPAA
jgi:hypothetical protein